MILRVVGVLMLVLALTLYAEGQEEHEIFLPFAARNNLCGDVSPKKALAWAYYEEGGSEYLCLPDSFLYLTWDLLEDNPDPDGGKQIPMLWRHGHYLESWCIDYGEWSDYVLFANEPLLEEQANMTAQEVGLLAAGIHECAPEARLIGPNMHPTVALHPDFMEVFWRTYLEAGGDPGALHANAFHLYFNGAMPDMSPVEMIDTFYGLLPPGLAELPVWITEVGYKNVWQDTYTNALILFEQMEQDHHVEYWFGYAPHDTLGFEFIDGNGRLTPVGRAFRDAGQRGK